jgi:GH24 family phage-related lysozyme (muramidase)
MADWDRKTPPAEASPGIALPEGGFKLKAYQDSAGYWTIGAGSRTMPDGSQVKEGDTLTLAEAEALFARQLDHYGPVIARLIPQPLITGQAAALFSMDHNCGDDALDGSVIQKAIAAGNMTAAVAQFPGWCLARNPETGVHEPCLGLMHRRNMDGLVWAGVDPAAAFERAYGARALTYAAGMALYALAVKAAKAWGYTGAPVAASTHPALTTSVHPLLKAPAIPRPAEPAAPAPQSQADALMAQEEAGTLNLVGATA